MNLKWTLIADVELLQLVTYVYPRNRYAALKLHCVYANSSAFLSRVVLGECQARANSL